MKKLIIFFAIAFCVTKSFTQTVTFPSEGTNIFGTISMSDWVQVDTFQISQMDSIRYLRIGGVNYVNKNFKSTTWDAMSLRLFANGSDQTARLTYLLTTKSSFIRKIRVTQQFTGNFVINGNVSIPTGVELEFDGVGITGTGSLNGAGGLVSGSPHVQIFDTTFTASNIKTPYGYFPATWFGYKADASTFNDKALLKAQAATPISQPVFLNEGEGRIKNTLSITKSFTGVYNKSILRWNPSNTDTNRIMTSIEADSVSLNSIVFDGSNTNRLGTIINDGYVGVEIGYCKYRRFEQLGVEKNVPMGVYFGNANHRLHVHHTSFAEINAKNTGNCRGLRGDGTVSPKGAILEYNTFDGMTNIGSGTWDSDQEVVQGFKDTTDMIIRFETHLNISKRGEKLQCSGITAYGSTFKSTRYLSGSSSYNAFAAYGNDLHIYDQNIYGVYETAMEIGTNAAQFSNISVLRCKVKMPVSAIAGKDGCRIYGKKNRNIDISWCEFENVQRGIFWDCSSTGSMCHFNQVTGSTQNAISTSVTSNSYPDTWNYGMSFIGNVASNINTFQAFDFNKINGGNIIGQSVDTVNQSVINRTTLDSLLGHLTIIGNRGPNSINWGSTASRPTIANPNACQGMKRWNTDTKVWETVVGTSWVAEGTGSGGITSITMATGTSGSDVNWGGSPLVANGTLTLNIPTASASARGLLSSTDWSAFNSKVSPLRTLTINGTTYDLSANRSWTVTAAADSVAVVDNANFTFTDATYSVVLNHSTAPRTVDIPYANSYIGRKIIVKNSASHDITLNYSVNYTSVYADAVVAAGKWVMLQARTGGWWVIEQGGGDATEGSYIPFLSTDIPSIGASTIDTLIYTRIGGTIQFSGRANVTPLSTSGNQSFQLSLPFSSVFTDEGQLSGGGSAKAGTAEAIVANIRAGFLGGVGTISISFKPASLSDYTISFYGQYKIR